MIFVFSVLVPFKSLNLNIFQILSILVRGVVIIEHFENGWYREQTGGNPGVWTGPARDGKTRGWIFNYFYNW